MNVHRGFSDDGIHWKLDNDPSSGNMMIPSSATSSIAMTHVCSGSRIGIM